MAGVKPPRFLPGLPTAFEAIMFLLIDGFHFIDYFTKIRFRNTNQKIHPVFRLYEFPCSIIFYIVYCRP